MTAAATCGATCSQPPPADNTKDCTCYLSKLRIAIAKATGETAPA